MCNLFQLGCRTKGFQLSSHLRWQVRVPIRWFHKPSRSSRPTEPQEAIGRNLPPVSSLSTLDQKIIEVVQARLGCSLQDVSEVLGASHPTVRRHITRLKKRGFLCSVRHGQKILLYSNGAATWKEAVLAPILADPRKREVVLALTEAHPTYVTINQIAESAGVDFSFAKRVLLSLECIGLVHLERQETRYLIRQEPSMREILRDDDVRAVDVR